MKVRDGWILEVVLRSMVVSFLGQLGCVGTRYRESVDLGMNRDDESLYQTSSRETFTLSEVSRKPAGEGQPFLTCRILSVLPNLRRYYLGSRGEVRRWNGGPTSDP